MEIVSLNIGYNAPDMDDNDEELLKRVEAIIARLQNGGETTKTKDELMFILLSEIFKSTKINSLRISELEKYRPYLQLLAYVTVAIGSAIIALAWSIAIGHAVITFP